MTFTTITFLIFLTIVFSVYWSLRSPRSQNALLIVASYVFYGWWDWRFCGLMLAASLVDFWAGHALERTDDPRRRRLVLAAALTFNLSMLGVFKYFNFFADSLRVAAGTLGWQIDPVTLRVILPVGISFYTFQTMSYSIDIYWRRMRGTNHLIDYLAFVSFFPQLVAGPIERASHMLPQYTRPRRFDYARATDGCRQILWGFVKKLLIADTIAPVVDAAFNAPAVHGGVDLGVASVLFAFQIYYDFSAYSDIAVGLGKLFGFELMRNFAYPYFSTSLAEFWRRWHISLSTWFRDYVFVPLGGSRTTRPRHANAIMVTFLLSGLWHGAAWTFVGWGALHGAALLPESLAGRGKTKRHASDVPGGEAIVPSPGTALRMLATFTVVCIAWVLFRAATLADAWLILRRAGGLLVHPGAGGPLTILEQGPLGTALPLALAAVLAIEWVQRRHEHPLVLSAMPRPLRWAAYQLLVWLSIYVGTIGTGSPFIYFQF
ncbi:MAG: MBOAT family O-acyltransferase [Candidatus Binatia bacterium]